MSTKQHRTNYSKDFELQIEQVRALAYDDVISLGELRGKWVNMLGYYASKEAVWKQIKKSTDEDTELYLSGENGKYYVFDFIDPNKEKWLSLTDWSRSVGITPELLQMQVNRHIAEADRPTTVVGWHDTYYHKPGLRQANDILKAKTELKHKNEPQSITYIEKGVS